MSSSPLPGRSRRCLQARRQLSKTKAGRARHPGATRSSSIGLFQLTLAFRPGLTAICTTSSMDKGVRARCRASCALAVSAWSHASCGTTTGDGGRSNLSTVVEWLTDTGSSPGCILTKAEVCHCARVFASSSSGLESDMTAMRPNSRSSHEQHAVSGLKLC